MSNRIIIWHIPYPGASLPAFYMERDYTPQKVRIHANQAPGGKDCEVDIRDDGTTILNNRTPTLSKTSVVYSEISYNTLVGTFQEKEIITGGTSSAKGIVKSDKLGNMTLELWGETAFTVGETITGGTSGATAAVLSFYRGGSPVAYSTGEAKTTAVLPKGANLEEDAEDFIDPITIEEGSILTCHEIEMGGAQNVTVQLELESLDEEGEESD